MKQRVSSIGAILPGNFFPWFWLFQTKFEALPTPQIFNSFLEQIKVINTDGSRLQIGIMGIK